MKKKIFNLLFVICGILCSVNFVSAQTSSNVIDLSGSNYGSDRVISGYISYNVMLSGSFSIKIPRPQTWDPQLGHGQLSIQGPGRPQLLSDGTLIKVTNDLDFDGIKAGEIIEYDVIVYFYKNNINPPVIKVYQIKLRVM